MDWRKGANIVIGLLFISLAVAIGIGLLFGPVYMIIAEGVIVACVLTLGGVGIIWSELEDK